MELRKAGAPMGKKKITDSQTIIKESISLVRDILEGKVSVSSQKYRRKNQKLKKQIKELEKKLKG